MISSEIGVAVKCDEYERYLAAAATHGYGYVHFSRFLSLSADQLRSVASSCDDCDLRPFSAHGPSSFLPGDPTGLDGAIAEHFRAIEKASLLGVHSITYHMASVEGVRDNETEKFVAKVGENTFREMNLATIRSLAKKAAKHGMSIALENRDQGQVADYCKTIESLKRMIDAAGEPNVGICLDSGHAHTHSDLDCADMILEAGELLIDTHFHDNFGRLLDGKIWGNGVINDLHRPPGIGTINWIRVVDALERIGYRNPIMFEVSIHTEEDDLDTLLRVTRDNWSLIGQARRYTLDSQGRSAR